MSSSSSATSGPSAATSGPSIMGVPIPPELSISEAELMEYSVEDLESYINTVSSMVSSEYSSIVGFDIETSQYQTLINSTQSTIDGLDMEILNAIMQSSIALSNRIIAQSNINIVDSTIAGYQREVSTAYSTFLFANSTINGLDIEYSTLSGQIQASDIKFLIDASNYSSLYYTYLSKKTTYETHVSSISTIEFFLNSTIIQDNILTPLYDSTLSTFNGVNTEIAVLNSNCSALCIELQSANDEVTTSITNRDSTLFAITRLSSLYEVALLNYEYSLSLSSQTTALESKVGAATILEELKAQSVSSDSTQYNMALALVSQKEQEYNTITSNVNLLASTLNKQVDTSYQDLLSSISNNIGIELQNISTFSTRKRFAYSERDRYSTLMEQALSGMRGYILESSIYTSNYISTLNGITILESIESRQQAEVTSDNNSISMLRITLSNLSTQLLSYMSTYDGWVTLSSLYTNVYNSSMAEYSTYNTYYLSSIEGLNGLNRESTDIDSTITGLMNEISMQSTIERKSGIRIRQYSAELDKYSTMRNKAEFQYQETYVREKRLQAQEEYENLVIEEIQRVSSIAREGNTEAYQALDLEKATIQNAYARFVRINDYLNMFEQYYGLSDTIASELETARSESENQYNTDMNALQAPSAQYVASIDRTNQSIIVCKGIEDRLKPVAFGSNINTL